jgi:hypothetical protein
MVKGCRIMDLNINCRACWECWWIVYDRVKEKQWPSVPSFIPSCPPRCSQITLFYPIKGAGWASTRLPFFAHLDSCDIIALSSGEIGFSGSLQAAAAQQNPQCSLRLMQWSSASLESHSAHSHYIQYILLCTEHSQHHTVQNVSGGHLTLLCRYWYSVYESVPSPKMTNAFWPVQHF